MSDIDDVIEPVLMVFRTQLRARLLSHAVTCYLNGSAQMTSFGHTLKGIPITFEGPPMQDAINFANKHAARLVKEIDTETRDRLAKTISDAIKEKRGVDGLARDIRNEFDDMGKVRSKLIARTETNTSLSKGSFDRAKDMGVTGKSWLTVGDGKVRPSHQQNEAAGVIPIDEKFPSGDLHPPGVDGFNCRCVTVFSMLEEE